MRSYRHGTGAALALLVFLATAFEARSQMRYNGGFTVPPKTRDTPSAPTWRQDSHPPMHFGLPRLPETSSYRSYYVPTAGTSDQRVNTNPYGISSWALPWMQSGFEGYDEVDYPHDDRPIGRAEKYTLESQILPEPAPSQKPNVAILVARLPKEAPLWVEGALTTSKGWTRFFETPTLNAGKHYRYTVRAVWCEDGKWVSQTYSVPMQAGKVACVYLTLSPDGLARKMEARVQSNLAKLMPDDRKVAQLQKVCVVQADCRLGSKGVPVKVMVNNRRVFVASADGIRAVKDKPDEMLARALELRKKNTSLAGDK